MTFGPLIAAAGFLLLLRMHARAAFFADVLPGILLFGLGLSATVSPLTAAILGDIDQRQAGIGSAINNAIARVAGLLAVAAIGALLAARFGAAIDARPRPPRCRRAGVPLGCEANARWSRPCRRSTPTCTRCSRTRRSARCARRCGRWPACSSPAA
jgi:hypothetical protein